jgi:hypothetical protein
MSKSVVRPQTYRRVMFDTRYPLHYKGSVYPRYCTYGRRFTWQYLMCLLFGHTGITYTDVNVNTDGVKTIVPARCCDRTYYPANTNTKDK